MVYSTMPNHSLITTTYLPLSKNISVFPYTNALRAKSLEQTPLLKNVMDEKQTRPLTLLLGHLYSQTLQNLVLGPTLPLRQWDEI